jgi:hypothetical protein
MVRVLPGGKLAFMVSLLLALARTIRGSRRRAFFKISGYEVEIAFEFAYSKPTKITCLSCKELSYGNLSNIMLDKLSRRQ